MSSKLYKNGREIENLLRLIIDFLNVECIFNLKHECAYFAKL